MPIIAARSNENIGISSTNAFRVRSRTLNAVEDSVGVGSGVGSGANGTVTVLEENTDGDNEVPNVFRTNCDTEGCEDSNRNAHIILDEENIPMEYTCLDALMDEIEEELDLGLQPEMTPTDNSLIPIEETLYQTFVTVDYEALVPQTADVSKNERLLQWRILLAAVEEVGLDRCDFDRQREQQESLTSTPNGRNLLSSKDDSIHQQHIHIHQNQNQHQQRLLQPSQSTVSLDPLVTLYAIENDLPASSSLNIPCQNIHDNQSDNDRSEQCIPVRTVLALKYQYHAPTSNPSTRPTIAMTKTAQSSTSFTASPGSDIVQAYVKDILKANMMNRTQQLYVGDVVGLYYVGVHDEYIPPPSPSPTPTEQSISMVPTSSPEEFNREIDTDIDEIIDATNTGNNNNDGDSSSIVWIGSTVSAASAVILLAFLLVIKRRRRQDPKENLVLVDGREKSPYDHRSIHDDDNTNDIERGTGSPNASMLIPTMSSTGTGSGSMEHDETMTYSQMMQIPDMGKVTPASPASDSDDNEGMIMADTDIIASVFRKSFDSSEGSSEGDALSPSSTAAVGSTVSLSLPPRHPQVRRSSANGAGGIHQQQQQQRRRRRKKRRKKQPVLMRVNSREQVNTMEAIPEVHDDDENEDEVSGSEGSEYYSSTDDDGVDGGSGSFRSHRSINSGQSTPTSHGSMHSTSTSSSPMSTPRERFPSDKEWKNAKNILNALNFHFDTTDDNDQDNKVDVQNGKSTSKVPQESIIAQDPQNSSTKSGDKIMSKAFSYV